MPIRKRKPSVTSRDQNIFKCLWQWKTLPTSAIADRFFRDSSPYAAYIRLLKLEKSGLLEFIQIGDPGFGTWMLTKKSFRIIREDLVELRSEGFKSENVKHDWLSTSLHLGEWLCGQPEGAQVCTEQQLRRVAPELWPPWVPRSELHRPDGFSLCKRGQGFAVVAFEAELSVKTSNRYERVAAYYQSQDVISKVVWLVSSAGMQTCISQTLAKYGVRDLSKHAFIPLDQFMKHGWDTKLLGSNLGEVSLSQILGLKAFTNPLLRRDSSKALKILNLQKRPITSASSELSAKDQKA